MNRFGTRIAEQLAGIPGAEHVRHEVLQETLRFYQEFMQQAHADPALQTELALAYSRLGGISYSMGATDAAVRYLREASARFAELLQNHPDQHTWQRRLAENQSGLGLALAATGAAEQAQEVLQQAIVLQQSLQQRDPENRELAIELARSQNQLGLVLGQTPNVQAAAAAYREAGRLLRAVVLKTPHDPDAWYQLAAVYNNQAGMIGSVEPRKAIDLFEQSLDAQFKSVQGPKCSLLLTAQLALTYNNLGAAQRHCEDTRQAVVSHSRAITIQRQLVQIAPDNKTYQRGLGISLNNLGLSQLALAKHDAAQRSFAEAVRLTESLADECPQDPELQSNLGGIFNNVVMLRERTGDTDGSLFAYQRAIDHQQRAFHMAHGAPRYRLFLSKHLANYGRLLRDVGKLKDAARVTGERRVLWPGQPDRLLSVAKEFAQIAVLARQRSAHQSEAIEFGHAAAEVLREVRDTGWPIPPEVLAQAPVSVLAETSSIREAKQP